MTVRIADMPESFADILEERNRLLRQRALIDERLRLIEELISLKQRLFGGAGFEAHTETQLEMEVPGKEGARQRNVLSPSTITSAVRDVLLEAGSPLKRGALLRELDKRAIPVIGTDRAKVLGTMIWRAKTPAGEPAFINTPKGYWPADVPLPHGFEPA